MEKTCTEASDIIATAGQKGTAQKEIFSNFNTNFQSKANFKKN